jgi:hypothetical protein
MSVRGAGNRRPFPQRVGANVPGILEGKKKDAHWGDMSSSANGRLCPNPESARASKLLLFTSAGLIPLCTKLAAQSNHKRRRVKIIYFMTYINVSYPLTGHRRKQFLKSGQQTLFHKEISASPRLAFAAGVDVHHVLSFVFR